MKFSLGKQIMISEEASHILSPLIHKLVLCINAVKVLHSVCQQIWKSNQSNLKEISPEYSLEGLMLKVKLQYFGHCEELTHLKRP